MTTTPNSATCIPCPTGEGLAPVVQPEDVPKGAHFECFGSAPGRPNYWRFWRLRNGHLVVASQDGKNR